MRGLRMYSPRPSRLPPTTRCAGDRPRIVSDRWLPRPHAMASTVPAARPMTGTADGPGQPAWRRPSSDRVSLLAAVAPCLQTWMARAPARRIWAARAPGTRKCAVSSGRMQESRRCSGTKIQPILASSIQGPGATLRILLIGRQKQNSHSTRWKTASDREDRTSLRRRWLCETAARESEGANGR